MYIPKSNFYGTLTERLSANAGMITTNDGRIGLQYESTVVAQYCDTGIMLNTGSWYTNTTKKWINVFINDHGYSLYQKNFKRYVSYTYSEKVVEFYDGMILGSDTFE